MIIILSEWYGMVWYSIILQKGKTRKCEVMRHKNDARLKHTKHRLFTYIFHKT